MRDALRRSGEELKKQGRSGVEVRIGINTGEVVLRMVHTGGPTEYTPVRRRLCFKRFADSGRTTTDAARWSQRYSWRSSSFPSPQTPREPPPHHPHPTHLLQPF